MSPAIAIILILAVVSGRLSAQVLNPTSLPAKNSLPDQLAEDFQPKLYESSDGLEKKQDRQEDIYIFRPVSGRFGFFADGRSWIIQYMPSIEDQYSDIVIEEQS